MSSPTSRITATSQDLAKLQASPKQSSMSHETHGLSAQQSALIQVYDSEGLPVFGLCWTFRSKELSLVLASTKDVHFYNEHVDVDLLVTFIARFVVDGHSVFPLSACPNFGRDQTFLGLPQLEEWLKIHLRLVLQMTHLWNGRDDVDNASNGFSSVPRSSNGIRTASEDELRQPAAISHGLGQISKFLNRPPDP